MMRLLLPTYDDVVVASKNLETFVTKTPVLTSSTLNKMLDAEIFFKCENFQKTGSFKFRGAMNALAHFSAEQKKAGVIAFSSGNHAQGIALAAQLMGIPAMILMPQDAPKIKIQATQGYGAEVVFYDRYTQNREEIGQALAVKHGMTLVPSYDHFHVIAGQGTTAKELIEEIGHLDFLFVGLGGGGMLAGSTLATKKLLPECQIYGVEPEAGNDGQQSLQQGKIIHIDTPSTIADGAQVQHLGERTFPIIQQGVEEIVTVSDAELIKALRFFAERMKIVVEPTGCLGLAGLSQYKEQIKGKHVGCIITGGNIDLQRYANFLTV